MTSKIDLVRSAIRTSEGYVPGEQPRGRRYIKLNTNENPYPPSPRVAEALHRAISDDLRLYPDPVASELRQVAARVYGLLPEEVLAGNGSDDILTILFRACLDAQGTPGSSPRQCRVAFAVPTYSLYDTLGWLQGSEVVRVRYPEDFTLPVDELVACDARLTVVCNPNAPSGTLAPLETIEELVRRASGLVAIDEAYADFAAANCLSLVRKYDNVVVLRTFSKSYSLAGMRIGLALGPRPVVDELYKVKDSYNLDRLALAAAQAALEDQHHMLTNVGRIRTSRDVLAVHLRELGFVVPPSHTNFLLARRPGFEQRDTYLALRDRGILVRYFDAPGLRDALRISVGLPEENAALIEALREARVDIRT